MNVKTTDLCKGNYLHDHLGRILRVTEIQKEHLKVELSNGTELKYHINTFKPIKLNRYLLTLMCDFKFNKDRFELDGIILYDLCNSFVWNSISVEFVHELQNIYHLVRKKELPIKLPAGHTYDATKGHFPDKDDEYLLSRIYFHKYYGYFTDFEGQQFIAKVVDELRLRGVNYQNFTNEDWQQIVGKNHNKYPEFTEMNRKLFFQKQAKENQEFEEEMTNLETKKQTKLLNLYLNLVIVCLLAQIFTFCYGIHYYPQWQKSAQGRMVNGLFWIFAGATVFFMMLMMLKNNKIVKLKSSFKNEDKA